MKSQQLVEIVRKRLLKAVAEFSSRHQFPFQVASLPAESVHWMALGAMAFADDVLELDRPDNLGKLLAALDFANEANQ